MELYPHVVKAITGTPWLILPESLATIVEIVNTHINGDGFSDEDIKIRLAAADHAEKENPRVQVGGGVGVLSLNGPVFPKANLMTRLSGATSLDVFASDLQQLLADDSVKQIVMDINSPGGSSDLVQETGQMIREANDTKPIYAVANTTAGSAALWLGSQASKFYATPSGKVGSLGVYTVHEDISAQDAQSGRKVTIVSSGDFKTALSPHSPLSAEAQQYLQESVDELKGMFVEEVAAGRNLSTDYVNEHFGNAKMFSAKKAAEINMVDGVMSVNELLGGLVESNAGVSQAMGTLQNHVSRVHALIGERGPELLLDGEQIKNLFAMPNIVVDGTAISNVTSGGDSVLTPEQLLELKAALGLGDDVSDDELVEKAKAVFSEHSEFKANLSAVSVEAQFAQQNPEMYAQHMRLLEKDRASEAKSFVSSISTIKTQVGDKQEETEYGLSGLSIETISEAHQKFASGSGTLADFEAAITAVTGGGIVKFGETGSARVREVASIDTSSPLGLQNAKKQFAEKVNDVILEHAQANSGEQMDYMTAVRVAAQKYPDLAEAYQLTATA